MTIKTPIATFVLGILASVAFYELTGPRNVSEREPLAAGTTRAAPVAAPRHSEIPPWLVTAPKDAVAVARANEVAHLRAVAAEMRDRATAAEEQLELAEGHPTAWPNDTPAAYRREAVEKQIKEFVIDRGLAKLKSIECSEYPCVEVLQLSNNEPRAMQDLQASLNEMIKRYYEGSVALMISSSGTGSDGLTSVSIVPNDDEIKTRTHRRTTGHYETTDLSKAASPISLARRSCLNHESSNACPPRLTEGPRNDDRACTGRADVPRGLAHVAARSSVMFTQYVA